MTVPRPRRRTAVGVSLLILFAFLLPERVEPSRLESRERVTRQIAMSRGGRLSVQTSIGDILVRGWNRDLIELRVDKTGDSSEDLALVPVDIQTDADQVMVTSRFPPYAPDLGVKVDYDIRLPAEFDLKLLETGRGRVEISGVTGRSIVRTVQGPVRIRSFSGILDVETITGEIDATVDRLGPSGRILLETFNGDIRLRLSGAVKGHFALRTLNGTIESHLPLAVQHTFGPQVAHESNGVDEPMIRLSSVNGSIRVTR